MSPLLYLKAGAAAVVVAVLIWGGLVVNHWHRDSLSKAATEAQAARERADYAARLLLLQAQYAASQKAAQGLENELASNRAARKPAPVVRVLQPARLPSSSKGGTAALDHGSTPAAGELPGTLGPDIGADLYGLADEADEVSARLRACQALLK